MTELDYMTKLRTAGPEEHGKLIVRAMLDPDISTAAFSRILDADGEARVHGDQK